MKAMVAVIAVAVVLVFFWVMLCRVARAAHF